MKIIRLGVLILVTGLTGSAFGATPELPKSEVDRLVGAFLPSCPDPVTVTTQPLQIDLSPGLRATIIRIESENPWCQNQALALATSQKTYFVGSPWIMQGLTGTPAAKIKQFAWGRLQASVDPAVGKPRKDGLLAVTLTEKTPFGPVTYEGAVDPAGTIFLPGEVRTLDGGLASARLSRLESVAAKAPTRGSGKVRVYEFSDFECPSCAYAQGYADAIAKEFGDRVKYVRIDLPLLSSHPWAFPAAVYGRAIWNQSPEAFWDFKRDVYANQSSLDTFSLEDFARGFVRDRKLNVEKFNDDIHSVALRNEILDGVSATRSLQINGTPTFMVDGVNVVPGDGGVNLMKHIREKLK
jgi:protein-disulfide isomerase